MGGYRLGPGATLPPLVLDDEQAVAVAVALRALASGRPAGVEGAAVRALLVLEQVLPARLRHRVDALNRTTVTVQGLGLAFDPSLLTDLASACDLHQQLRLGYTDREGAASERLVEPHRLVHLHRRWYLMARDPGQDDWRTFRLDRIGSVTRTGRRFVPTEAPDPARYVTTAVSSSPYRYRAVVLLGCPAEQVAPSFPPSVGLLEPVDDSRCRLTVGADDLDMIAVRLAMLGVRVTVLEPPGLLERMHELAGRLSAAVSG
jgi:predicted DNA-binding transcriptional regulator YafY